MNRMLGLSVFCAVAIIAAQANPIIRCPLMRCMECSPLQCDNGLQPVKERCSCCPTCGVFISLGESCPVSDTPWQCADGSECLDGTCKYSTGGPYVPGSIIFP